MDNVFRHFVSVPYTYYHPMRGGVNGLTLDKGYTSTGVFKYRNSSNLPAGAENTNGVSRLKVLSDEVWIKNDQSVAGDLIKVGGRMFEIIEQPAGTNFAAGVVEHYTLSLREVDYEL